MKKKKSTFSNIILITVLLIGLSLLLYPSVSDYWNSITQSRAVANYAENVVEIDEDRYKEIWAAAVEYNKRLAGRPTGFVPMDENTDYLNQLAVDESGVMGYIEIPSIKVSLPVYHGTGDDVLQVAIGHLEWTSLPVGGESTHCVVSGHRGLPSAKLFTQLDQLREGDLFMLGVLNEVLTYEVDQILIVEPDKVEALRIVEGMDYCTLLTCTPYGVNSHRLLVRGHRVENVAESKNVRIIAEAMQIEPLIVAPIVAAPMLLVLLIGLLMPKKYRKKKGGYVDED